MHSGAHHGLAVAIGVGEECCPALRVVCCHRLYCVDEGERVLRRGAQGCKVGAAPRFRQLLPLLLDPVFLQGQLPTLRSAGGSWWWAAATVATRVAAAGRTLRFWCFFALRIRALYFAALRKCSTSSTSERVMGAILGRSGFWKGVSYCPG